MTDELKLTSDIIEELTADKGVVIPTTIIDPVNENLVRIEFHDDKGNFVIQALWDDMDEQTDENKVLFRKWAYNLMRDKGYEIQ